MGLIDFSGLPSRLICGEHFPFRAFQWTWRASHFISPMTPEEEQKKAERAKRILYIVMAVFIILPFILLILLHFR